MKTYTIDRSKWRCGGDHKRFKHLLPTKMLNRDNGRMCCLGQILKEEGATDEELVNENSPRTVQLNTSFDNVPKILLDEQYRNSQLTKDMIRINDSKAHNMRNRETLLRHACKGHFRLKFIGRLLG